MSQSETFEVVVGAGAVGQAVARRLVAERIPVRLASRHGTAVAGAERWTVDASDPQEARELAAGARVVYFCPQPPIWAWSQLFPRLQESVLAGAESAGAVLVSADNLYGYGRVTGPIHEGLPHAPQTRKGAVRAAMADQLLGAHTEGRLRTVVVRAADLYGPAVRNAYLGSHLFPALLGRKTVRALGDPDMPHSYTFVDDFASAMITLAHDESGSGGVWHVPNAPTRSTRELLEDAARISGTRLRLAKSPKPMLQAIGLVNREVGELVETLYQFQAPFVVDHSKFAKAFGDIATPQETALERTVGWWRAELAATGKPVSMSRTEASAAAKPQD